MSKELAVLNTSQELLAAAGMTEEELAAQTGVMGMEGIRQENLQIPRLSIAQPLSPQMIRSKPEYIEGLMVGQYFNTVTREVYGDTVTVVPVKFNMSRIKFTNNVLDCRSKNGVDGGHYADVCKSCQFSKWGSGREGKGTDCKEYLNFLVVEESTTQPMVISFKSASLAAGKTWSTLIVGRKIALSDGRKVHAPAFMTRYLLKTVEKTSGQGVYYVPVVSVAGPSDAALVSEGMALHKSFKGELDTDESAE
jgi:hypothetical protein